jgi:hypothetical protein
VGKGAEERRGEGKTKRRGEGRGGEVERHGELRKVREEREGGRKGKEGKGREEWESTRPMALHLPAKIPAGALGLNNINLVMINPKWLSCPLSSATQIGSRFVCLRNCCCDPTIAVGYDDYFDE